MRESDMPFSRGKKPTVTGSKIPKLTGKGTEKQEEGPHVKRSSSPPHGAPKKRTAFIDITNAHKVHISLPGKKKQSVKKTVKKTTTTTTSASAKNEANLKKSSSVSSEGPEAERERAEGEEKRAGEEAGEEEKEKEKEKEVAPVATAPSAGRELPLHLRRPEIPEEFDVDSQHSSDCSLSPEYAKEIFDYLKKREEKFVLTNYMLMQPSLSAAMRAILVDWLVEVQENFELNHETLYLAVALTDHFLSSVPVKRESLQLIGSTAMLIASKFEERSPPLLDDFLYICDDAYKKEELISMESRVLLALGFDINIPIPYRFLRRYAKCVSADMPTLTLARYVCELSLHEMDLVPERGSLLASACLLLALLTKSLGGWSPVLQFHTGYCVSDVAPVVRRLHSMLSGPRDDALSAVRNKYSHKVFFEVASLPVVSADILEGALSQ